MRQTASEASPSISSIPVGAGSLTFFILGFLAILRITVRCLVHSLGRGYSPPSEVLVSISNRNVGVSRQLVAHAGGSLLQVMRIDFYSDAVSSPIPGSNICSARSHERIEHRIANKTKHSYQTLPQL